MAPDEITASAGEIRRPGVDQRGPATAAAAAAAVRMAAVGICSR